MCKQNENKPYCIGKRHIVTLLSFITCGLLNANRLVVGVGIVAMVKHSYTNETPHLNASEPSCPVDSRSSNTTIKTEEKGEMDWDSKQQGYVLVAGFLGCFLTQIIGGKIADSIGAKLPLVVSNIVIGASTFISPFAARWNIHAMILIQLLRSLSQGFVLPSLFRMMSNWYPRNERGPLTTIAVSGHSFGAVFGGVVTGWFCDVPSLGWSSAFYFWGIITAGIGILLQFVLYEVPQNHPNITESELKYITEAQESNMSEKRPTTPWKKIFTSIPCYAFFYGLFGHYWSVYYFLSVHPTFMGTILHLPMTENGAASCLPILTKLVGCFFASFMSNWLMKKNYVGVDKLRKYCTLIGCMGFTLCMVGIIMAECDTIINIICVCFCLFSEGIALSGVQIACIDMTPVFAGSLMGVASTIASLSTVLIPMMTGFLTTHGTLSEWHLVFWISIAIVGSSGFVYVIFGSADVQPWNFPEGHKSKSAEERPNNAELSDDERKNSLKLSTKL
ncbi:hypothetical protein NPIL_90521 [Nephila pilipes]|uniref:Major facilitator superfamily (MFS) profile domain-containing protein n=1 Tax=Nephila pilipes TaxID=299642 RepID=A0A8X6QGH6_NEPPI|nr:hypothetical protein NPIL_90521 [Nephila pilipes]